MVYSSHSELFWLDVNHLGMGEETGGWNQRDNPGSSYLTCLFSLLFFPSFPNWKGNREDRERDREQEEDWE